MAYLADKADPVQLEHRPRRSTRPSMATWPTFGEAVDQVRAGDRRGWQTQAATDRPAKCRQEHAGPATRRHLAADGRERDHGRRRGGYGHAQWLRTLCFRPALVSWSEHPTSAIAMIGGGSHPAPGEISPAHHGIPFLVEPPEFNRRVLEAQREPLEAGSVMISRAARQARFCADFQLGCSDEPLAPEDGNPFARRPAIARQGVRYPARSDRGPTSP